MQPSTVMNATLLPQLQAVLAFTGPWATGPEEEVSLVTRIRWAATSADALLRLADSEGAETEITELIKAAATLRDCPARADKFCILLAKIDELAAAVNNGRSA